MAERHVFLTKRFAADARNRGLCDFVACPRVDIVGADEEEVLPLFLASHSIAAITDWVASCAV